MAANIQTFYETFKRVRKQKIITTKLHRQNFIQE